MEDIIPWGIANTNRLNTDIAVAISDAKPALAWVYENTAAIGPENMNIIAPKRIDTANPILIE